MNIKRAFTLVETILALTIIGVLCVILIKNVRTDLFEEKSYVAQAYKVLESFEQASIKIREKETTKCPTGTFITEIAGTPEFTLYNSGSTTMTSAQVYSLYSKYIRFSSSADFCSNTGWDCSTNGVDSKKLSGGKLPTGAYVALEVTGLIDCPSYYLPEYETPHAGSGKCWGKLYLDANGIQKPNTLGKDVFIYGLSGQGIAR